MRLTDGRGTDCAGLLIGDEYSISRSDGIRNDVPKAPAATGLAVYTLGNGYELALNALSRCDARARIPLGIRVAAAGKYTLEYNESFLGEDEAIEAIWVEDNGVQVANLLATPYLFTAEQGTDESRFVLRVVCTGDSDTPTAIDEGQQTLTDIPAGAEIEVFDALGHCVLTTTATQDWVRLRLPIGVYTLRKTYGGCSTTRKIVARY